MPLSFIDNNALDLQGGLTINNNDVILNRTGFDSSIVLSSAANSQNRNVIFQLAGGGAINGYWQFRGRVLKPETPAFSAWNIGGTSRTGDFTLNTVLLNNGGGYNTGTGRYTVPVAGMYYFSLDGFTENDGTGSSNIEIRRNGGTVVRTYTNEATGVYRPFSVTCIISCNAGDFVSPWSGLNLHGNQNPVFAGFLIG